MRVGAEGILHAIPHAGITQTVDDAQENLDRLAALASGRKRPLLVDLRATRELDRAARALYAGDQAARIFSAAALLIDSPLSRVVGNFFLGLNKPAYPLRLFSTEPEALLWLAGFLG